MIGTRLTERETGAEWEVVGAHGGEWIVRPIEHGSPEAMPTHP